MSTSHKIVQRFRNDTILWALFFITLIHMGLYLFSNIRLITVIIAWLVSSSIAVLLIFFSYIKMVKLSERFISQSIESEKQSQRQVALATLSAGFATILSEDEICQELANRLYELQGYEYVAIYLLEEKSDNRILKANVGGLGLPDAIKLTPGKGLSDRAITRKRLQYTPDVSLAPNYIPGIGSGSEVDVPIQVDKKMLGVIVVENSERYAFSSADFSLLTTAADQAAVAIQNAQLYDSAKKSADQLMVLHKASREITSSSFDPEKTYAAIHEAAKQLMPCEAFTIAILDEEKDQIEGVYLFDKNGRSPSFHIPSNHGLSGHIIKTGEPLLVHDFLESQEMVEVPVEHFGNPEHIRAFIAVPMKLGEKIMGMLSAQSYFPHDYTNQDRQMLEMLAAHAAIAIDNAHLFAQVQHLAITDSLTNVYNRRYFFEIANNEFSRSLRYRKPLSIIMIDLDNYKEVNDRYGHIVGDNALRVISKTIADNIRQTDILGRYGGDEFCLLLPETNIIQAAELAERLKTLIKELTIHIDQAKFSITISAGVSCSDISTKDFSELLLSADIALYHAKKSGRNQIQIQKQSDQINSSGEVQGESL